RGLVKVGGVELLLLVHGLDGEVVPAVAAGGVVEAGVRRGGLGNLLPVAAEVLRDVQEHPGHAMVAGVDLEGDAEVGLVRVVDALLLGARGEGGGEETEQREERPTPAGARGSAAVIASGHGPWLSSHGARGR